MPTTKIPEWTIGDRLGKVRRAAGIGVAEIAAQLGVSRNTVTNWETDHTRPRRYAIDAWARACGDAELADWIETGDDAVRSRCDSATARRLRPSGELARIA